MRKVENPSMVVRYARCNFKPNLFSMVDWQSNKADVLHVAALLDQLPSKLILKASKGSCKAIIHSNSNEDRYFLMPVLNEELFEYKPLEESPFLPSAGLQGLKVSFKGDWRNVSLKFEFPVAFKKLEIMKGYWKW